MREESRKKRRPGKSVASTAISAVSPDGKPFLINLKIMMPYQCETGEWACPVIVDGVADRIDARGNDSYQALCLAMSFAQNLLQDFSEDGGKLLMDGANFPLEAYSVLRRSIADYYKKWKAVK